MQDIQILRATRIDGSGRGDPRAFQHGINFVGAPGGHRLIWAASAENIVNDEWTHDVFFASLTGQSSLDRPATLIAAPLAQEPASAAMTGNGNIMVTMEDAWQAENTLRQSYAVFDHNMRPVTPYQQVVLDGGHSGHVAATDNRFVVVYSEGWVDGGGVDDLGSGDDVWLKSYDPTGRELTLQAVAVGPETRDWWPLVAGADDRVMLVWQRFVAGSNRAQLLYRVFDAQRNRWITTEALLPEKFAYYTYDIQFLKSIGAFLLVGTTGSGEGVAYLIDTGGRIMARTGHLPAFIREAQPAVQAISSGQVRAVYPAIPDGLMILGVTADAISLSGGVSTGYRWHTAGIDGVFTGANTVVFADLAPQGLTTITGQIVQE